MKTKKLKPYMIFNRIAGKENGTFLAFHYTAKEAKKISWGEALDTVLLDCEYIEMGIKLIKNAPWLYKEMENDKPHIVENPRSCNSCGCWGHSYINESGLCCDCQNEITRGAAL